MESNWRFNVWKYGVSHGDFTLVARRVDVPVEWLAWVSPEYGGIILLRENPPDSGYLQYAGVILLPPGVHFPAGIPVEPDT